MGFKKAERKQVKIKIAIAGPSGSGKTFSALLIAKGIARRPDGSPGRIALLDTENDSASLYAGVDGMPDFDAMCIGSPFLTSKYVNAINDAVKGGYDVLVIDSGSHQWSGEGGILDRKDKEQLARPTANGFTLWAKYTPEHEAFKAAINQSPIHVIMTMRSKQDYVLEQNGAGKSTPKKVGMAPIQREGQEYEFTVAFDMSMENYASAAKDRTNLFAGRHFKPSEETGAEILSWLNSGKAVEVEKPPLPAPAPKVPGVADRRLKEITAIAHPIHWPKGSVSVYCELAYGVPNFWEISEDQYALLTYAVRNMTSMEARTKLKEAQEGAQFRDGTEPPPEWDKGTTVGNSCVDEAGATG